MELRNYFHIFLIWPVNCENKLCSEALIAKIYFTKIQSSAQALDSFPLPGKMPPIKFLYAHKTKIFML